RDWSVTGVQTCALPIWKVADAAAANGQLQGHGLHRSGRLEELEGDMRVVKLDSLIVEAGAVDLDAGSEAGRGEFGRCGHGEGEAGGLARRRQPELLRGRRSLPAGRCVQLDRAGH